MAEAALTAEGAMSILEESRVPCGPVYNVADMMSDPHFNDRELFEKVEINGEPLNIPAILPKLSQSPGATEWPGPKLASHTDDILQGIGITEDKIKIFKTNGIVADA